MLQLTIHTTYTPQDWRAAKITSLTDDWHRLAHRHNLVVQHIRRAEEYADIANLRYLNNVRSEIKDKMAAITAKIDDLKNN